VNAAPGNRFTVRGVTPDNYKIYSIELARKAAANRKRHRIDFADAATVLHDEQAITVRDDEGDEERYVTIGMDALGNVLVVVYTWRGDRPHLISARKATPQEREQYGVQP
jgi:uncharacterized DUF497 family protein